MKFLLAKRPASFYPVFFSIVTAILVYFSIFGWYFLYPPHTEWMLSGDSWIYFFGFNFFNHEAWQFPPGAIASWSFPEGSSVVYTDSIPLIAISLKFFHLGGTWQFTGIWLLLCFILQAGTGALILFRTTQSGILAFTGSLFFLTLPSLFERLHSTTRHYSLIAHFIILLSIGLFSEVRLKKNNFLWSGLLLLSLGIHFYLFFIALLFWFAAEFEDLKTIKFTKHHAMGGSALLIWAWFLGYFTIPLQNSTAGGFGAYSMNLISIFNSAGQGFFLPGYVNHNPLQQEGYQYLGLGLLLLLMASDFLGYLPWKDIRRKTIALVMVFFTLLALSFQLSVFQFIVPEWLTIPAYGGIFFWWFIQARGGARRAWAGTLISLILLFAAGKIVRATGRFLWPVEYFAIFLVFQAKPKTWIVIPLLLLQLLDLKPLFDEVRTEYAALAHTRLPTLHPEWSGILTGVHHISLLDPNAIRVNATAALALEHGLSIGPMLVARASSGFRKQEQERLKTEVIELRPVSGILYLVGNEKIWSEFQENCKKNERICHQTHWGELDGYRYFRKIDPGSP